MSLFEECLGSEEDKRWDNKRCKYQEQRKNTMTQSGLDWQVVYSVVCEEAIRSCSLSLLFGKLNHIRLRPSDCPASIACNEVRNGARRHGLAVLMAAGHADSV